VGGWGDDSSPLLAAVSVEAAVGEPVAARELEVLRLLATPMSRREIADRLYISLNTVKTHQRVSIANSASPTGNRP
jgi:LuxR family transcriptional regulator, maltose regulon positive regulatory protein